jgi:4-amino-4-deoxy-L-arabinose transferase-like glycosyltransferase
MTDEAFDRTAILDATAGRRRVRLALLIIFLVALVLRLAVAQWAAGGLHRALAGDEPDYVTRALSLADGRGIADADGRPSSLRMPGLPALLAAVFSIAGPNVAAARVVMCVLGALLAPLCYLLGSVLGGRRAGLPCAALAAVFPNWVWYSGDLMTDLPCAALGALLAWMLVEAWRRDSLPRFALAGLIGGVGVLFRATMLVFVPGIVLWIFLVVPGLRRRVAATGLVCGALVCALAPWAARNTAVQGEFVPLSTQGGIELFIANNPRATGVLAHDFALYRDELAARYPRDLFPNEARRSAMYERDALSFIRGNFGRFLRLCAVRVGEFWKVYSPRVPLWQSLLTIASFGLALPFAALAAARRGWRRGPEMLFVILIASQTALHAVFTSVIRYRISIEPFVLALAVAGFVRLLDRRAPRARVT